MKHKIFIFSFLVVLVVTMFAIWSHNKKVVTPIQPKIDSLEVVKDSLQIQRDTIYQTIIKSNDRIKIIDHWYEKEVDIINNQPVDDDMLFFSDYLSKSAQ